MFTLAFVYSTHTHTHTHARTHARMERRLFQNYRHACVCMQIRFLICIHAREASSMYKPPRARVCKSNLHTRARSFMHSRHAFMQITMSTSTKDLVPFYDLHLWTFERLGETVQLCNVYWHGHWRISIKRMR